MNYDQYKLETPPDCDDYYDYLLSHHECKICMERDIPEKLMVDTDIGWMHPDCYNDVVKNAAEDGSRRPKLV